MDKVAKRGALLTRFKDFDLINTHLYPDNWGNDNITYNEFDIVKKHCNKRKPTILAGDLNMKYEAFKKANNGFFELADDVWNTFGLYNEYVKKWWEKNVTTNKKLDYVLIRDPEKKKITFNSRAVRRPVLSDHYGIYSEIEIK